MKKETKIILGILAIGVIGGVAYYFYRKRKPKPEETAGEKKATDMRPITVVVAQPSTQGVVSGASVSEQKKPSEPMARIVAPAVTSRAITGKGSIGLAYPQLGIYIPETAQLLPGVGGAEYLVVSPPKGGGRMVIGELGY